MTGVGILYALIFILLGGAAAQAFDNKDATQAVQIVLSILFVLVLAILNIMKETK